ncbi:MAG: PilZ domain-containing protein [Pseudomonadota bacterium]
MDQRQHIRVQVPMAVEISHPAIGTQTTTARDVSEGGVFVRLSTTSINVGAKIKIRVLNLLDTDTQHTPSVDMEVRRTTDEGLGLAFLNKTGRHLWSSVQRLRDELEIGRDYFQVHQSIVLHNEQAGVLLVQQDGKWLLPGHYLTVGQIGEAALLQFCKTALGVNPIGSPTPIVTDSAADISVLEAATFRIIYALEVKDTKVNLKEGGTYREVKWTRRPRDLNEITFAAELQRDAADLVLSQHSKEE